MAVFSRITLLAGTAARCVHAMNRRGLAMANPTATFKTTKGEFKVELFQDQLPITTSNFKDLATSGFYDGLTLPPLIKGFMCQFGCPNSANPQSPIAGTGGPPGNTQYTCLMVASSSDGGGNIPDELVGEISNEVGTISMANTGAPNSRRLAVLPQHEAQRVPRLLRQQHAVEAPGFRQGRRRHGRRHCDRRRPDGWPGQAD